MNTTQDLPPLPEKKPAIFTHPTLGLDLYDALEMDLHAMKFAEAARVPLLARIAKLEAENEALRKDAGRWEFARDKANVSIDNYVWITTKSGDRINVMSGLRGYETEQLIDAAIKEQTNV